MLYYCFVEKKFQSRKYFWEQMSAFIIWSVKQNSFLPDSLLFSRAHFYCRVCHSHIQDPEQIEKCQCGSKPSPKTFSGMLFLSAFLASKGAESISVNCIFIKYLSWLMRILRIRTGWSSPYLIMILLVTLINLAGSTLKASLCFALGVKASWLEKSGTEYPVVRIFTPIIDRFITECRLLTAEAKANISLVYV